MLKTPIVKYIEAFKFSDGPTTSEMCENKIRLQTIYDLPGHDPG